MRRIKIIFNIHKAIWIPCIVVSLALFMLACAAKATPTPTAQLLATATPQPTSTPTPTATATPTSAPTAVATPTPTATAIRQPASTPTPIATATSKLTPSPTATPTATKGPLDLPDLVIVGMGIMTEKAGCVLSLPVALGVSLTIGNTGTADAGPFVVDVNGVRQTVASGLPRGKITTIWFSGYQYGGESTAVLDVTSQVEESNEENNRRSQLMPLPTPPPTCTPTPTRTPTPTFTPTPTATVQSVIISPPAPPPTPTATRTPMPTSTPTPVPLFLTILEPEDGSVVEVSPITIRGKTIPEAVVSINGDVADVAASGNFALQVVLEAGPNVFDIIATDQGGSEATAQLTIYLVQ